MRSVLLMIFNNHIKSEVENTLEPTFFIYFYHLTVQCYSTYPTLPIVLGVGPAHTGVGPWIISQ